MKDTLLQVANKVWKTDANGNPGWRDDADTTYQYLPNPFGLTLQLNGKTDTQVKYDGTSAKIFNVTPSSIGAATTAEATRTSNGLMSSSDKSKLDDITEYTEDEIQSLWTAVVGS